MCGFIAQDNGPASVLSWMIEGAGDVLSGLSYAELSSLVPSASSADAYTYVALGEALLSSVLDAGIGISNAAIARNCGGKVLMVALQALPYIYLYLANIVEQSTVGWRAGLPRYWYFLL
jgi:amino acid transporter